MGVTARVRGGEKACEGTGDYDEEAGDGGESTESVSSSCEFSGVM